MGKPDKQNARKTVRKVLLFWHAAGVSNYHDRFESLSKHFELTCVVAKNYKETTETPFSDKYKTIEIESLFNFHPSVFLYKTLSKINFESYDVIYIHEEPYSLNTFQIVLRAFRSKTPYILDSAVINMRYHFSGYNFLERFVLKNSSGVYYRNEEVKNYLLKRGVKKDKLISSIPNGVKLYDTMYKSSNSKTLTPTLRIGYAGRIRKDKGLIVLANSLKHLKLEYFFQFCGLVEEKETLEKVLFILPKSKYLGVLNAGEMNSFYESIDILILPSIPTKKWTEQFGRVLTEAIAKGVYACGSKIGFIPEIVGVQNTFPANNEKELSKFLNKISNEELRRKEWENQHNTLTEKYSWDAISYKLREDFNDIL